jgi:phage-related holin
VVDGGRQCRLGLQDEIMGETMKQVYVESWALFRRGFVFFIVFSIMIEALMTVIPSVFGYFFSVVTYLLIAFRIHHYFLRSTENSIEKGFFSLRFWRIDWSGSFKFFIISLLIGYLPILAMSILFVFYGSSVSVDEYAIYGLFVLLLPINLVIASFFGTLLPAAVERDLRFRLSTALMKTHILFFRLVIGPGWLIIAGMATSLLLSYYFANPLSQGFDWLNSTSYIINSVLSFFIAIIGSSVLCSVYRMIVPAPEAIGK